MKGDCRFCVWKITITNKTDGSKNNADEGCVNGGFLRKVGEGGGKRRNQCFWRPVLAAGRAGLHGDEEGGVIHSRHPWSRVQSHFCADRWTEQWVRALRGLVLPRNLFRVTASSAKLIVKMLAVVGCVVDEGLIWALLFSKRHFYTKMKIKGSNSRLA